MEAIAGIPISENVAAVVAAAIALVMRLSMMMFFLPAIGETAIPVRVRITIVLALAAALFSVVVPDQLLVVERTGLIELLVFESLIGFALGFSFRVLMYALQVAGMAIAQAINLSQLFSAGLVAEPNPTAALLLMLTGGAIFVSLDWHTRSVALLSESYALFPLGEVPSTAYLGEWALERTVGAFRLGISLALPFLLIGFLYNVVLGLINQAMPQMMVTFIGVPANVLAGFVVMALAIAAVMTVWADAVSEVFRGFW